MVNLSAFKLAVTSYDADTSSSVQDMDCIGGALFPSTPFFLSLNLHG